MLNPRQIPDLSSDPCPNAQCQLEGQPDLYGFGTRFGIYLTWMASFIANNWLPNEYDGALDTNTVFLFALAIAVSFYAGRGQLRKLDVLILLQLCLGFLFTVMSIWGYRTAIYWKENARGLTRFGGLGTHVRLCILSAVATISMWFWTHGYRSDRVLRECKVYPSSTCEYELRIYLFGTHALRSTFPRTFYATISGIYCVYYGVMILGLLLACCWRLTHKSPHGPPISAANGGSHTAGPPTGEEQQRRPRRLRVWPNLRRQRAFYTRFSCQQFRRVNRTFARANAALGVFVMVNVEMTLAKNNVTGVWPSDIATYGQILPLSIGGLGLIKALMDCVTAKDFEEQDLGEFRIAPPPLPSQRDKDDGLLRRLWAACVPWMLVFRKDGEAGGRLLGKRDRTKFLATRSI